LNQNEHDVVVVGAGLAGLTSANRALDLGLNVTVLEASSEKKYLCASRLSGGLFHVGYKSVMAPSGELFDNIRAATHGHVTPELAQAISGNAQRAIKWLQDVGVEFAKIEPDQGWRDFVAAPLGFYDQSHFVWEDLGADVLLSKLENHFVSRGGRFFRNSRARELVMEGDSCRGVTVDHESESQTIHAVAVILADGGFQGNQDLLREFVTPNPENLKLRGPSAGQGDGIRMARKVGASLIGMPFFYGHVLSADCLHNDRLCPFPFVDFLAAAGMLVDSDAKRFVDESKAGVFMANALTRHGSGLATVVFDDAIWESAGKEFFCPPNPNLVDAGGTLYRADTLEELAVLAGLPLKSLIETVRQRNQDVGFGMLGNISPERGALKYQGVSIGVPPFYAAPACACITHTTGGLIVDDKARVLRDGHTVIKGLLASGSTVGGLEGGPETGYIGGLIKSLVFGMLAAETIASQSKA
jgi:fumarate reductase flavoprotein subunit